MYMHLWRWERTASMWEAPSCRTVPARVRGRTVECQQTPAWWCTVWETLLRRYDNTSTGTATRCPDLSRSCRPQNHAMARDEVFSFTTVVPYHHTRYNVPQSSLKRLLSDCGVHRLEPTCAILCCTLEE